MQSRELYNKSESILVIEDELLSDDRSPQIYSCIQSRGRTMRPQPHFPQTSVQFVFDMQSVYAILDGTYWRVLR